MHYRIATLLVLALGLAFAPTAHAIQIDWTGDVTVVEADDGTGEFTGTGVGDGFSGFFVYGNTCGVGCTPFHEPPDESDYAFSLGMTYGTLVTDGSESAGGFNASVNIQNDHALDADEAALATALTGMTVNEGTLVDVFTLAGETDDAVFDVNDELFDGGVVEVVLATFDTTLFDDTSFRAVPPALADVDFAFFFISEADTGNVVYEVIGTVDSVVPEPGAALLIAPALGLGLLARRRA